MYLVFLIVSCLLVSASAFVPRMKSTTGSNTALNVSALEEGDSAPLESFVFYFNLVLITSL